MTLRKRHLTGENLQVRAILWVVGASAPSQRVEDLDGERQLSVARQGFAQVDEELRLEVGFSKQRVGSADLSAR